MMCMNLWEPMREGLSLREAINKLFEDSVVHPGNTVQATRGMVMDVIETAVAFLVRASLPGCDKDKVEISFQGDTLTVKAEMNEGSLQEGGRYLLRERLSGLVTRSVTLPTQVDADRAHAEYREGILHLTLPKADSVKPRSIKIG